MFRNLAYDVTTLMKVVWDLEYEHALKWEQQQVTTNMASVGDPGAPPPGPEVSAEPLLEAESQMRAFTKEVSAWISECKTWNAKCKLAMDNNAQAGAGIGNHVWGGRQNCNNEQGWANQNQSAQRGAGKNNQNQNNHDNALQQTQYCQQHESGPPVFYKCRGWGHISHNCPSTWNYTEQGQLRDNLNYQWGNQNQALPQRRSPNPPEHPANQ